MSVGRFGHVALGRTFSELSEHASETDEFDLSQAFHVSSGIGWEELHREYRVVILSEAGSGKTEEFRTAAQLLRDEGKDAFFMRLENIPEHFSVAFDVGKMAEFEEWLASGREGWIMLDSVDEARLRNAKDFELALRLLGEKLALALDRTHIYISGRFFAWRARSDLDKARTFLPFAPPVETAAATVDNDDPAEAVVDEIIGDYEISDGEPVARNVVHSSAEKKTFSTAPFRILTLTDLTAEQIEKFASARGVDDPKAFSRAIERTDARSFASRPQDLEDLVASWLKRGAIGGRLQIMQDGVERRLKERNPDHVEHTPLSDDRVREGVKRLALATTLAKNPAIQAFEEVGELDGIDIEDVLPGWKPAELKALLDRPIFDPAAYGAVRFHHRTVREYLAASLLCEMLEHPASRRAIEGLFFKVQYGVEVVVPSMRPVLPWVALYDPRIRERIERLAPEVLFEGGDPAALPKATRQKALYEVAEKLAAGRFPDAPTEFTAVQRFAGEDLSDDMRTLLARYPDKTEVISLMLRMIWLGGIRGMLPEAKAFALQAGSQTYQRVAAIRAVEAIGTADDVREVRDALIGELGELNREWMSEIVGGLDGDDASVAWLLAAAERAMPLPKYTVDHLQDAVSNYMERVDLAVLPRTLEGFYALICVPPFVDASFCRISTRYSWLLHPAAIAVERLIAERHPAAFEAASLGILGLLPSSRDFDTEVRELKSDFAKLVPGWPELNRTLFWSDVARARTGFRSTLQQRVTQTWHASSHQSFWKVTAGDFYYFLSQIAERSLLDDKLVAVSGAFDAYERGGRKPVARLRLKKAVEGEEEEVKAALELFLHPPKRDDEYTRQNAKWKKQTRERQKRETENRARARERIRASVAAVRDPGFEDPQAVSQMQWYLHQQTRDKAERAGKWTNGAWRSLVPEFGIEVGEAYRDAAVRHWRRADTQLRSEGAEANTTTASTIFGLTGLSIDARETVGWVESLTSEDVIRAVRYASHELNGFPVWLPRLYAAHPQIVGHLLMQEIRWEIQSAGADGMSYVIDDIAWSGEWCWKDLGPRIFELLKSGEPESGDALNKLMRIVLSSPVSDEQIASLAQEKLSQEGASHPVTWFAVWAGVDAGAAIAAFAQYLERLPEDGARVDAAMAFATHLFGDRHSDFPISRHGFRQPPHLAALYRVLHEHIRREEDIRRPAGEAYSPTQRDNAQQARDAIASILNEIAGKEAYLAMVEIADVETDVGLARWMGLRARLKAAQDADPAPWSLGQVREFIERQVRTPANHRELAELAVDHVLDLKLELEDGDDSRAAVLRDVGRETIMRNYIANDLGRKATGRYLITQEEELADAKRPDMRFHRQAEYGPVPMELKLADKWSGPDLFERLEDQLSGDYLRDHRSTRGIFLLVYRGEKKEWRLPGGRTVDFDGLVTAMQDHWVELAPHYPAVDDITVIGIDLTKRFRRRETVL